MDESEVRLIQDMIEIMIIVIHLWWRKLTFINDVLGG